ncbi:MAG: MarR family transcriptional regulator [Chloroflexi bacterium]|nr:MarR family transcriptional regulator [Chloroflexota bacterium]
MSTQIDKNFAAWRTFLEAHSTVIRALERELQEDQQLPLTWFDVLAWLSRAPDGRLRMQVLADSVYLSNSGLTRLLDRMTAAGLVERQNCPDDRRGWFAAITAKGREAIERASPGHLQGVEKHFLSRFNEDEIGVLNSLLLRLTEPANQVKRKAQLEG